MIGREHGKSIFERICSNKLERHLFEEKNLNLLAQRPGRDMFRRAVKRAVDAIPARRATKVDPIIALRYE